MERLTACIPRRPVSRSRRDLLGIGLRRFREARCARAQLLVVSTDDAWFGKRRAATCTRKSRSCAPSKPARTSCARRRPASAASLHRRHLDARTPIDTQQIAIGYVGPPVRTLFACIGPTAVIVLFAALFVALFSSRGRCSMSLMTRLTFARGAGSSTSPLRRSRSESTSHSVSSSPAAAPFQRRRLRADSNVRRTIANNRITTKSWSFDYDHAQLSPDASTGTVEGVRHGIVFKKGKPDLKISAEKITLDTQSLDFTAIGKVHVEKIDDSQHRSFDTDLVTWTNNARRCAWTTAATALGRSDAAPRGRHGRFRRRNVPFRQDERRGRYSQVKAGGRATDT